MEITEDITLGTTSFIFYLSTGQAGMGGDAYSAPAIWKEVHTATNTVTQAMYYLHRDHLGSIVLITDNQGIIKEQRHFDAWGNIVKLTDGNGNALTDFVIIDRGYTGHEHLLAVGLVHMNGRLYDPLLHRFLQPDNYVQDPTNTQNFNRYGYVLNNPLGHVDPNGEFIHIVIGAFIGGVINTAIHWKSIKNFGDGLAAFGIGAAAGGLGAATGGASLAASGLVGASVAGGALAGAVGSAVASPVLGLGNMAYFGDKYSIKQFGKDVLFGGIAGGIIGGGLGYFKVAPEAAKNGLKYNIFNGKYTTAGYATAETPVLNQFGNNPSLALDENVVRSKMLEHAFVDGRLDHVGLTNEDFIKNTLNLVKSNQPLLTNGSNQWIGTINDNVVTFRVFVSNGQIINVNAFAGSTGRNLGTIWNFGKLTW